MPENNKPEVVLLDDVDQDDYYTWVMDHYGQEIYNECARRVREEGALWSITLFSDVVNDFDKEARISSDVIGFTRAASD